MTVEPRPSLDAASLDAVTLLYEALHDYGIPLGWGDATAIVRSSPALASRLAAHPDSPTDLGPFTAQDVVPGSPFEDWAKLVGIVATERDAALARVAELEAAHPDSPQPYHPDPAIDAEVRADAEAAERADLAAGYAPRWWTCPTCGRSHHRGHFMSVGVHRCMNCGYQGAGGTTHTNDPRPSMDVAAHPDSGAEVAT